MSRLKQDPTADEASTTDELVSEVVPSAGETSERDSVAFAFVDDADPQSPAADDSETEAAPHPEQLFIDELPLLEAEALRRNPELQRLQNEAAAAWARVRYVDELPDPTVELNVFGEPVHTADGTQWATLSVMQMIPWLARLDAREQEACFDAMAAQQMYESERLRVISDLRTNWAKLYLLARQLEIIEANRELLSLMIDVVNARIGQNLGTAGDVTLLTVEIGRLEEERLTTQQQIESTVAAINRLTNRPAETPLATPAELTVQLPDWSHAMLRRQAWSEQPEIEAARLRAQASEWGIEVARLSRRPDLTVNGMWMYMENGRDSWSLGAQVSIPLWQEKYDAMQDEAVAEHFAAHASVAELERRYDAVLLDLLQQARAADATATLYEESIIPQAEQTLQSDQQALINNRVDLERVIEDTRSLLTLQIAHYRAQSELAIAIARIQQAAGGDLVY